jgi:competence protein ComEC
MRSAIIAIVLVALLLFGCPAQAEEKPTAQNNTTTKTTVEITGETNTSGGMSGGSVAPPVEVVPEKKKGANYTDSPNDIFAVYFIYVGDSEHQGDAILIKRGDMDVLVDAGPEENANRVVDFLNFRGVDDIDYLISTHDDPEHYGGITDVMNNFNVEEFWWTGKSYNDSAYQSIVDEADKKGALVKTVGRGESFSLNGLNFTILNPKDSSFNDADNGAIAMKITQNKFCLLLTSDILAGAQIDIANKENVKCDIIQLPDHGLGAGTAMIDGFLLKTSPKIAIVSGGPSDIVQGGVGTRFTAFEKLRLKGIQKYENYINGSVRVTSDSYNYTIGLTQ